MAKSRITIPVFIPHTGCPHRCVFCNQWKVTGVNALPDRREIESIIDRYLSKIRRTVERIELAFFGGSFTGIEAELQEKYLSIVQPYIDSGAIHSIRLSTRPDYIDSTRLALLRKYRVETVELGVQSFADDVLDASGRGHTSEDSVRAVKLLKDCGFRTGIQLLPGLPCDTFEKSLRSAEITVSLKPDDVRIYPAVVLKDTALEDVYRRGLYSPMSIEETVELCSVMYGMFTENRINVIRMGLHPMDLNSDDTPVVAGPYHVAMGFMIKSRYRRRKLELLVSEWRIAHPCDRGVKILLPEANREEYIGLKRENIFYLQDKFLLAKVDYSFSDIPEALIV